MTFPRWAREASAGLSPLYVEWERNRVFFLPKSLKLDLCFQTAERECYEKIDSQINSSINAAITTLGRTTKGWEEERVALQRMSPFHIHLLKF